MCVRGKSVGLISLAFGVGIMLCAFIPAEALVVIQAAVIIGAGITIYISR